MPKWPYKWHRCPTGRVNYFIQLNYHVTGPTRSPHTSFDIRWPTSAVDAHDSYECDTMQHAIIIPYDCSYSPWCNQKVRDNNSFNIRFISLHAIYFILLHSITRHASQSTYIHHLIHLRQIVRLSTIRDHHINSSMHFSTIVIRDKKHELIIQPHGTM